MADLSETRDPESRVSIAAVIAACAAIAAAWLAAGSTGLLAEPLRSALTYLALAVAVVAGLPVRTIPRWFAAAVVLVAFLPLATSVAPAHHLFLVAAVTGLLAAAASGPLRWPIWRAA